MNKKELLYATQTLAEFANLAVAKVDAFRSKHPDFVPAGWWTERVITNDAPPWAVEQTWRYYQTVLRDAWREKFPLEETVELISAGRMLDQRSLDQTFHYLVEGAPAADFAFAQAEIDRMGRAVDAAALRADFLPRVSHQSWPYQIAVMFLASDPWRARLCQGCGTHFVADKPKTVYCGIPCSSEARRATKRLSWEKHGKEWRPAKAQVKGRAAGYKR